MLAGLFRVNKRSLCKSSDKLVSAAELHRELGLLLDVVCALFAAAFAINFEPLLLLGISMTQEGPRGAIASQSVRKSQRASARC